MRNLIITIITVLTTTACHDSGISESCNEWCTAEYVEELQLDVEDADSYAEELEQEIERLRAELAAAQQPTGATCPVTPADVCQSELAECNGHVVLLGEQYRECRDEKIRLQQFIESGCTEW